MTAVTEGMFVWYVENSPHQTLSFASPEVKIETCITLPMHYGCRKNIFLLLVRPTDDEWSTESESH